VKAGDVMNWEQFTSKVLGVARIGQKFSQDPYALENYAELEQLAIAALAQNVDPGIRTNIYERDIYPTPNISVRVIVFNEAGELLLVKEADFGTWSIPGGWCDLFESSSESGKKEVLQETGLTVKIDRLLAVLQREKYKEYRTLISEYVHYYSASILSGNLRPNHETTEVRFFPVDALPDLSRKSSLIEIQKALAVYRREHDVEFD
jgi:ADP-ribose pyrophosphatase YjhB (NUDIX family)